MCFSPLHILYTQVVVLTDTLVQTPLAVQKELGDYCHDNNIKFIVASTRGLCGYIQCYILFSAILSNFLVIYSSIFFIFSLS